MKKWIPLVAAMVVIATSAAAISVTLFIDTDTLIRRSHEIVIARCVSAPTNAPWAYEDGFYPAKMELVMTLKGERKSGEFTCGTIYLLAAGKTYLLCNSGGSAFGSDFLSVAELSVVEVPSSFSLARLTGKPPKDQISMILASRQAELNRTISELQKERSLLEKALGNQKKKSSEPSVGR